MTSTSPSAGPSRSPFKLLDSYSEKDRAIFFGREQEIDTLYRLLGESPLVLVYGPSGTGKTSVIQCGLTHKFSPTNWLPIMVRRGDDINAALLNAIASHAITPISAGTTLTEAIRSVYLDHLRPIYLIFDQFEEIYVLGAKSEQERFYGAVEAILKSDVACRMIVSLREEYLGALDSFERVVPTLYDKKLRVEAMTNSNVERVILGTVSAFGITLEHGEATARKIIGQISDSHSRVQLAYLQVYLDYLYRKDSDSIPGGAIEFSDAEVEEAGKLGDIMAEFLQGQEGAIQTELEQRGTGIPKGGIVRLLEEFVSVDATKQPTSQEQLVERVPAAAPWLQAALDALVNGRLLRLSDGRYELAHDALAAHIDDRRSGEEKQLLRVEKLVTNRFAETAQTQSLLNAAELALVDQARKQIDPFDGRPRLRFDDATERFISKSQSYRRRRLLHYAALSLAAIFIPVVGGFTYYASLQRSAASEAKAKLLEQENANKAQQLQLQQKENAIAVANAARDRADAALALQKAAIANRDKDLANKKAALAALQLVSAKRERILAEEQARIAENEARFLEEEAAFQRAEAEFQKQEAAFRGELSRSVEMQANQLMAGAIAQTDNASLYILRLSQSYAENWIRQNCRANPDSTVNACAANDPFLNIVHTAHNEAMENNIRLEDEILTFSYLETEAAEPDFSTVGEGESGLNQNAPVADEAGLMAPDTANLRNTDPRDFWARLYDADKLYIGGRKQGAVDVYTQLKAGEPDKNSEAMLPSLRVISMTRHEALLTRLFFDTASRPKDALKDDFGYRNAAMLDLVSLLHEPEQYGLYNSSGYEFRLREACLEWKRWDAASVPQSCQSAIEIAEKMEKEAAADAAE